VLRDMVVAHDTWDSKRVLSLGEQAEADLLIIDFPLKEKVKIEMFEMMARAWSRTAQYAKARDYFERLLALFDPVAKHKEHTRTQMRIADMCISVGDVEKAKVLYSQVYTVGERDGNFEFHSKACLGLSTIEKQEPQGGDGSRTKRKKRLKKAMTLAKQALIAAELMLDRDYGKQRDAAQAIISIIDLSDITSVHFDETLITRLEEFTTAVDATEEGGSSLCVKAAEIQWRREWAMSRWSQCANACAKTMRLASQTRFKQNPDVQAFYEKAFQAVETLNGLGFVTLNPER
jgi:tetratricopeptide (TPR) repeat protein